MDSRSVVTVTRKWNNPNILVWVNDEAIGMGMKLDDFVVSMYHELSVSLPQKLVDEIGNPTFLVTTAQLQSKINAAIKAVLLDDLKLAAAEVELEMRQKSATVV